MSAFASLDKFLQDTMKQSLSEAESERDRRLEHEKWFSRVKKDELKLKKLVKLFLRELPKTSNGTELIAKLTSLESHFFKLVNWRIRAPRENKSRNTFIGIQENPAADYVCSQINRINALLMWLQKHWLLVRKTSTLQKHRAEPDRLSQRLGKYLDVKTIAEIARVNYHSLRQRLYRKRKSLTILEDEDRRSHGPRDLLKIDAFLISIVEKLQSDQSRKSN